MVVYSNRSVLRYEQTKVVAKKSSFMNKETTVMDQINHILSNKERLTTRTLQNRNSVHVFGTTGEDNIFV